MDLFEALFAAVEAGDMAAVGELLDGQPWLVTVRRMAERDRRSALQVAAAHGHLDLCRLLVDRGAEVYPNPFNQYPPVMEAAWHGQQQVVDYFLDEIPHLAAGTNGLGVMPNLAARQGWTDLVAEHLARDPLCVNHRGWIGDVPLHWASHNNHVDIIRLLLDAGAEIEADEINCYGGKPLHWASEHAPDAVGVLLAAGAEVNSRNVKPDSDFYQVTPLIMNATQRDDCAEVAEQLLAAGADPTLTDARGKTALDHATERNLTRITAILRAAA